jgi:hypothetical protein
MQTMTWSRFKGEWAAAVLALSLAAPVSAQSLPQTAAPTGYSCIDPMASGARRTRQAEPCRLPLVAWPLLVDVNPDEPKRTATFEREVSAEQGAHELFWRLPWHGYPPHSARSASFWR